MIFKNLVVLLLASVAAALPRARPKPPSYATNSPSNRQAWDGSHNINTDYELSWPNTGRTVEYDFTITQGLIAPDGYEFEAMLVNGQYPGPPIIANWGDMIRVRVTNLLPNHNGTTIHWHGLRQYLTNAQDGVPGVTQCPIAPGTSQVYEFQATQYGTSWYHSHLGLQYPDGILGGIQINGPTSANYEEDLGLFLMTDWLHADAFSLAYETYAGAPAVGDSNLLNGHGHFNCSTTDPKCNPKKASYEEVAFEQGSSYKMHLVNTGFATQFTFWIDNHTFEVVSNDFVPVEPYSTDTLNLGPGQRYEIIVKANASTKKNKNFWINARSCLGGFPGGPAPLASQLGIIRYHGGHALPPILTDTRTAYGCADLSGVTPVVPRIVPVDTKSYQTLLAGNFPYPDPTSTNSSLHSWALGNMSLKLDWENPSLKYVEDNKISKTPASYDPIYLDNENQWYYFLILDTFAENGLEVPGFPISHPIHLHGHDFAIIAQSSSAFDASTLTLNLNNPPRRDVAMLPGGGYLLMAFYTNNPGVWLMHCHIAWHASAGMGLTFVEAKTKIKKQIDREGMGAQIENQCRAWDNYYNTDPAKQDDSGI